MQEVSNDRLLERALKAAKLEKKATLLLLECLFEIDKRRLYAARGYSSLFEYVRKALGYSESQASERVRAMRLAFEVKEVKQALEAGKLTLTSTARLASHVRREGLNLEKTIALTNAIEMKPLHEVDRILVSEASNPIKPIEKLKPISPEFTELKLQVDKEFMELLEQAKELTPVGQSMQAIFKLALKTFVAKKGKEKGRQEVTSTSATEVKSDKAESHTRYIPMSVRRELFQRSQGRCEYIDPQTKRRCEARHALEADHYPIPYAFGGASSLENLRHTCRTHNSYFAMEQFGVEKMGKYLKNIS